MRKAILLLLGLLLLVGCTSSDEKANKDDLSPLTNAGFSEVDAQEFYNFSNGIKIMFTEMSNINSTLESNNFEVPLEQRTNISAALEVSKSAYSKLNPDKNDEYVDYLSNVKNSKRSPLLLLDIMEKERSKFTIVEAAMIYDTIENFTRKAIQSKELSDKQISDTMDWYHSNNDYSGLFKDVHSYRMDN